MHTYAIIGASRGIGLEFVRQLAGRPNSTVFAIVRNPDTSTHLKSAISGLKNVHVIAGDVVDYGSLEHAAQQISAVTGGKLDSLIHNAALTDVESIMKGFDDYPDMDTLDAEFTRAFQINTLGVIHGIAAFLPLLRASTAQLKRVVVIGSRAGDPAFFRSQNMDIQPAYAVTKAAGHVAAAKWAVKLKDENFVVVTLCPGAVNNARTIGDHGSPEVEAALMEASTKMNFHVQMPEEAVGALLKIIDGLKPSDNGLALASEGQWST